MDSKQAKALHRRARLFALKNGSRFGSSTCPDDFAQYCIVYALEHGMDDLQLLKFRYIDYLREKRGRHGAGQGEFYSETAETKFNERVRYLQLGDGRNGDDHGLGNVQHLAHVADLNKIFSPILPTLRLQYFLVHKYGFTLKEIADMRGRTEGRICQEMTEVSKMLAKRMQQLAPASEKKK